MCCWVLMFKSLNFLGPSNFPILSINSFCRTQGTIPWQLQAHPGRSSREASVSLWRHWSISASTVSSMMAFLWMILFPCSLASQIPRSAPSVILVPWLVSTCTTQWAFLRLMRWRMFFFFLFWVFFLTCINAIQNLLLLSYSSFLLSTSRHRKGADQHNDSQFSYLLRAYPWQ